jgi:ribosomal protein L40E
MTDLTRTMTKIMMMALVIITTLGALPAKAGPDLSKMEDKFGEVVQAAAEQFVEYSDKETGGLLSFQIAFAIFTNEGRWIRFSQYSNETRLFMGLLMISLFFLLYYRNTLEKKPVSPILSIGLLVGLIIFAMVFECMAYLPQTETIKEKFGWIKSFRENGSWFLLVVCIAGLGFRYKTLKDLRTSIRGGASSFWYFCKSFTHNLSSDDLFADDEDEGIGEDEEDETEVTEEEGENDTEEETESDGTEEEKQEEAETSQARVCPRCNAPLNNPLVQFCRFCGYQFGQSTTGQSTSPPPPPAREEEPKNEDEFPSWLF